MEKMIIENMTKVTTELQRRMLSVFVMMPSKSFSVKEIGLEINADKAFNEVFIKRQLDDLVERDFLTRVKSQCYTYSLTTKKQEKSVLDIYTLNSDYFSTKDIEYFKKNYYYCSKPQETIPSVSRNTFDKDSIIDYMVALPEHEMKEFLNTVYKKREIASARENMWVVIEDALDEYKTKTGGEKMIIDKYHYEY